MLTAIVHDQVTLVILTINPVHEELLTAEGNDSLCLHG